ncbi:MAG TPA: hypothetical protein VLF62_00450 [Candidatus Saccharimonadales bacterium]|nr:hypothetical protein [Candidatus Saccharimonadales bacterium]
MATTKKKSPAKARTAPKRSSASRAGKSVAMRASASELQAAKTIQLLVVCFTVLSVVFAIMAFWRYSLG